MRTQPRLSATIITFVVLALACGFISSVYAQSGRVTLKPTADTYVDSNTPTSNYGGQPRLDIGYSVFGNEPYQTIYNYLAWLKFDLSTIPNGALIDEATLQVYVYTVSETANVDAYSSSNNSWSELTLTYSDMPSYDATSLDTTIVTINNQWYNWSVVDAVRSDVTGNFNAVTMVLGDPSPQSSYSVIASYSKEVSVYITDYSPILTIHWSGIVPEIPSLLSLSLLATGALLVIVFYKKSARTRLFL
jgi:hypothetical protein